MAETISYAGKITWNISQVLGSSSIHNILLRLLPIAR